MKKKFWLFPIIILLVIIAGGLVLKSRLNSKSAISKVKIERATRPTEHFSDSPQFSGKRDFSRRMIQLNKLTEIPTSEPANAVMYPGEPHEFEVSVVTNGAGELSGFRFRDPSNGREPDFNAFWTQIVEFGNGLRLVRTVDLPISEGIQKFNEVLDNQDLQLSSDEEMLAVPLEVFVPEEGVTLSWLLVIGSSEKSLIDGDGTPAGIRIKNPPSGYKRSWFLLPDSDSGKSHSYFVGETFEG